MIVADDQAAVREPLAAVLDLLEDIDVVATAADGEQVLSAAAAGVDVVLMDLRMPGTDGIEATRRLGEQYPDVAVVVLTTFADDDSILAALAAGARGYLTKDSGRREIARAVRGAAAGQSVLDRSVQERLLASLRHPATAPNPPPLPERQPGATGPASGAPGRPGHPAAEPLAPDLTPREREVLALIGQGLPNRGIAEQLFISEATVKTHINNLFAKAGIRDRADAVRRAIAAGLA